MNFPNHLHAYTLDTLHTQRFNRVQSTYKKYRILGYKNVSQLNSKAYSYFTCTDSDFTHTSVILIVLVVFYHPSTFLFTKKWKTKFINFVLIPYSTSNTICQAYPSPLISFLIIFNGFSNKGQSRTNVSNSPPSPAG